MIHFFLPSQYIGGAEKSALLITREIFKTGGEGRVTFTPKKSLNKLRTEFEEIGLKYTAGIVNDWDCRGWFGLKRNIFLIISALSTFFLLYKHKPRIVFVNLPWPYSATGCLLACAILKKRTVVRFALVPEKLQQQSLRRTLMTWSQKRNQIWVALSENNRRLLSDFFSVDNSSICLIYNGYSNTSDNRIHFSPKTSLRNELDLHPSAKILLTVGALTERKGHDILIAMAKNLFEKSDDVFFVWVGTGALENKYKETLREQGLFDQFFLLGERKDIPRLMKESDMFVFPSRDEGLPNVLLEAIAHKLPVIASNISSMPEIIHHKTTGLLAEPNNPSDFMKKILYALNNPNVMEKLADTAFKEIDKFSYKKMMNSYLELLVGKHA